MMIRLYVTLASCLATGVFVAHAGPLLIGDFSPNPNVNRLPEGWLLKERVGRADFSLCENGGVHALGLHSTNTSFSLQREINVDLAQYPVLSWKWKVTKLPEGGDFRRSKSDDQAAQLFLAFSKTQFIVYIWDSSAPEGYIGDAHAPPFMSIKVVVVRSSASETGKWLTESRNVAEDYQRLFGRPGRAPVVHGVRLQINTQHTRTSAESYFADLQFQEHLAADRNP